MTASQAVRTLWIATVVVVLLCVGVVAIAGFDLSDGAALRTAMVVLIAVTVLGTAVRVTGKVERLRAAAIFPPPTQSPTRADDEARPDLPPDGQRTSPPGRPGGAAPQHSDLFVTLSRRQQSLSARLINEIDALERQLEDPDLLKVLFRIDHLASRIRRQSENLAVLGGTLVQGRNVAPEPIAGVLRAAVAETEHYAQIVLVSAVDIHLRGHVVAEIVHLLAELMENATKFTSPDAPKVAVRASTVAAGVAIDIEDRGVGIQQDRLRRLNAMLGGAFDSDLHGVVSEGHIGLAVVRLLASHHDVKVRLNNNIYGGIDATVVVPTDLLVMTVAQAADRGPQHLPQPAPPSQHSAPAPRPVLPAAPPQPAPQWAEQLPARPAPGGPADDIHDLQAEHEPLPRRRHAAARSADPDTPLLTGVLDVDSDGRPPLPQRVGSYLHPGLATQTSPALPAGGHDPGFFRSIQAGRRRVESQEQDASPASTFPPTSTDEGTAR